MAREKLQTIIMPQSTEFCLSDNTSYITSQYYITQARKNVQYTVQFHYEY